jgi:hypothetical protein
MKTNNIRALWCGLSCPATPNVRRVGAETGGEIEHHQGQQQMYYNNWDLGGQW